MLALAAQQGDKAAFNQLYLLTRDRAYYFAISMVKNEDDALDVLQDSYLNAWKHLGALEQPELFASWLNRIVGNVAKNALKKHRPLLFDDIASDEHMLHDEPEPSSDYIPHQAMDHAETQRILHVILQTLPDDQRLCVLMRYYHDMPVREIAQALEVPAGTVMSRLGYARKKIGHAVQELDQRDIKLFAGVPAPLLLALLRTMPTPKPNCANLPLVILSKTGKPAAITAATAGIAASVSQIAAVCVTVAVMLAGSGVYQQWRDRPLITPQPTLATTLAATDFSPPLLPLSPPEQDHRAPAPHLLPPFVAEQPNVLPAQVEHTTTHPQPTQHELAPEMPTIAFTTTTAPAPTTQATTQATTTTTMTTTAIPTTTTATTTIPTTTQATTTTAATTTESTTTAATTTTTTETTTTAAATTTTESTTTAAVTTTTTETTTTTAVTTTTTTATTTTNATLQYRTLTDAASGISIHFREDFLPQNVVLVVQVTNVANIRLHANPTADESIASWRIEGHVNGFPRIPTGPVTVRIPVPASFAGDPQDLRIRETGQLRDTRIEGGYVVFETTSL